MKDKMLSLWEKVKENRELVIRIGCGVAGALIGAGITHVIENAQTEDLLVEEMVMSVEEQ